MRRKYQSLRYIHAQQAYNCTQKQLGLGYGCGFPNKHDIQTQKPIETQDPNPNSDPKTFRNPRPKPKQNLNKPFQANLKSKINS